METVVIVLLVISAALTLDLAVPPFVASHPRNRDVRGHSVIRNFGLFFPRPDYECGNSDGIRGSFSSVAKMRPRSRVRQRGLIDRTLHLRKTWPLSCQASQQNGRAVDQDRSEEIRLRRPVLCTCRCEYRRLSV